MILTNDDVIRIITDKLTLQFKETPSSVKIDLNPDKIRYDSCRDEMYYETTNFWNNVIKYTYGKNNHKYINAQRVREYILMEFPDSQYPLIEIVAKNGKELSKTHSIEEIANEMQIHVMINIRYRDRVELTKKDYMDMIDISLMLNDKQWFKELSEQYMISI